MRHRAVLVVQTNPRVEQVMEDLAEAQVQQQAILVEGDRMEMMGNLEFVGTQQERGREPLPEPLKIPRDSSLPAEVPAEEDMELTQKMPEVEKAAEAGPLMMEHQTQEVEEAAARAPGMMMTSPMENPLEMADQVSLLSAGRMLHKEEHNGREKNSDYSV